MENTSESSNKTSVDFSFHKEERLCSKKVIDKLFTEGNSFLSFPLKVIFLAVPSTEKFPARAAFTVGKRNFKKAVHRNLIKRKMRESYRLNKHFLYENLNNIQLAIFFIFIGKEIPEFTPLETAMKKGIKKLINEVSIKSENENV